MNFKLKTTRPESIPLSARRNTSPSEFNFIKTALAVALISPATFLFSGYAYAACPADSSSGVNVTSGETCTAALSNYQSNGLIVLKTKGAGSILNVTAPAVQVTQGGTLSSQGGIYSESGGVINVQGSLNIFANGTGSYNTAVTSHFDGSIVNLGSRTNIVHHGNSLSGAGIAAQLGKALITADGPLSVTTDGAPAIYGGQGGTIVLKDINLTVGNNGNPNPNGILVTDTGSSVSYANGVMNTSGTAIRVLNGGAVSASGSTELTTTLNQAQGISVDGPASSGTFNGSTSITTSGAEAHGAGAGNQGTIKLLGGGAINTAGQQAYGLFADAAGSQITMQGGSINTAGLQGGGVLAQNAGQAALVGTSVITQGDAAQGLQVLSGGTVDATGVSVLTNGSNSQGLYSDGAGSAIRFYGGAVATNNTNSNGIFITNEGTVALRRDTNGIGSVINTGGAAPSVLIGFGSPTGSGSFDADGATVTAANGSAIYAQGSGSSVLVNDSTLNGATGAVALIQGAKATVTDSVLKSSADSTGHAIQVSSASAFTGTGLDISTTGQGGRGVSATGVGSTVSLGSSKISTTGENGAYGLFAEDSANVIATGLDINTTGLNSHGAFALTGAAIDVSNSTVFTSGDSANSLVASGAGSAIKANNTTLNTSGQQAYGALADAAGSQITMQGGSINTTGLQGSGVLAQNAGQAALVGTSVTTQGDAAQGLQALSGGTVDATGVSVLTSGSNSRGLYSDGAGSAIRFYGGTVATNNTNSNGIFITNEGTVALRRDTNGIGSVINTGGAAPSVLIGFGSPTGSGSFDADGATVTAANGSAIYAQGSGSSVLVNDSTLNGATGAVALIQGAKATVTDSVLKSSADSTGHAIQVSSASAFTGTGLDISTTGQGGRGVSATGVGSTVSLGSSKISTTGENGAYGLFAEDSANVIATGLDINTTGLNSHGAFALTGAAIDVSNSTVFTSGDSANSLVASGAGSAIKANNTTLNTSGQQAYGALADQGKIDMVNSTLFTTGQNSNAINAFNSGIVNVTGSSILTSGQGSTGIKVLDDSALGSTVNLFSTQVRTEGTDAWAADVKGTLNMQGGTLSSASYGAILASGDAIINLENSAQVVGGNGTLLSIANENSLVNLTLDNNVYALGNITFANPSNADALLNSRTKVSLLNSSSWTGSTNAIDSLSLDPTSKWMVTGDSKLNRLDNSGSIYVGGALGTTVTVNDTYTSNGGLLSLKTQLGNDASPTDKLVAGKVVLGSGATRLEVNNVNGLGALTTGDGIEVVHVNDASASAAGAFALGNRVAAGAYEYTLQQNGLAGSDGNWYLRSTTNVTPPVVDPVTRPNYRPEVPLNMALPALTNRFSLAMLGTYHDRRAESSANDKDTTVKPTTWGRVLAEKGSAGKSGYGAFMDQGSSYDYDIKGFQVGQDLYGAKNPNGTTDVAGIYVGRGDISGNVDAVNGGRAGSASMDATSLGAYWTRKGENGWYVDSVLQGTVYSDVKTNSGEGEKLRTKGRGMTASVEGGYPIALGNNWAVEPQAQLIYQQISLDRDQDTFGKVKFDDTKIGYARIGSRLTKQLNLNSDQPATVWARANVWQQIGPDSRTTFTNLQGSNAVSLDTRLGGTWAQIGVGVTGKVTESISAFVGTDYNQTMGSGDGHSISGRVGFEVTW